MKRRQRYLHVYVHMNIARLILGSAREIPAHGLLLCHMVLDMGAGKDAAFGPGHFGSSRGPTPTLVVQPLG